MEPQSPQPKRSILPQQDQASNNSAVKKGSAAALITAMIATTMFIEGGYVNDRTDPGGETNMGITKVVAVQNHYTGAMRVLPKSVAQSIYYHDYIVKTGYEPLISVNAPVVSKLFDASVNMGSYKPSSWFQQSINSYCHVRIPVTGHVDQTTRTAFSQCQMHSSSATICVAFLDMLDAKQKAEYQRLIRVNPALKKYYRGWVNNRIGNIPRSQCKVTYASSVANS